MSSLEQAASLDTPSLVVGTVPDFPPQEAGEILARDIAMYFLERKEKGCVLKMCYHPNPRTAFYEIGQRNGWQMLNGAESMIRQGVAQQVLWSELPLGLFDVEVAKKVIHAALKE